MELDEIIAPSGQVARGAGREEYGNTPDWLCLTSPRYPLSSYPTPPGVRPSGIEPASWPTDKHGAAGYLGISPKAIYTATWIGKLIPQAQVGHVYRHKYTREALDNYRRDYPAFRHREEK